ncbi:hypothetical protein DFH09DRAFT_1319350 [Mycena vulgaris]|nr:hypothetical protein DFH09DRAFT_1319350 [Mycena vulgaris]
MRYYACHDITPRSYSASAQSADAPPYALIASLPWRTRYVDVTPPSRLSVMGPIQQLARTNPRAAARPDRQRPGGAFAHEPSIHRPWRSPSVNETHPAQPADDESRNVAPRLKGAAEPKWSGDAAMSSRTMPTPRSLRRGGSALVPRGGRSVDAQGPGGSPGGATS